MKRLLVLALIAQTLVGRLIALPAQDRRAFMQSLTPRDKYELYLGLRYDWKLWARPEQLSPVEQWRHWYLVGGRGSGKTRPAAQQVIAWAEETPGIRIALIGRDAGSVRRVMVKGESGILACSPPWFRPRYEPTNKLLVWPNGSTGELHSASEPETIRGPNYHKAWCEELFHWPIPPRAREPVAWVEGIRYGVRLGDNPQTLVTSSPRRTEFCVETLLGHKDPHTGARPITPAEVNSGRWSFEREIEVDGELLQYRSIISRWSTERNRANLSPGFAEGLRAEFGDTALARQELDGEILGRVSGAIFDTAVLDLWRRAALPRIKRTLVAVDPTRSDAPRDEAGIVVGGVGEDDDAYVWDDCTVTGSPQTWAQAAVTAYHRYTADAIVYEENRMPEGMKRAIESTEKSVKWCPVRATKGKATRAEPVSALYEQGRVHHVRDHQDPHRLDQLEEEMVTWVPGSLSPNRMDAVVWLVTALLIDKPRQRIEVM